MRYTINILAAIFLATAGATWAQDEGTAFDDSGGFEDSGQQQQQQQPSRQQSQGGVGQQQRAQQSGQPGNPTQPGGQQSQIKDVTTQQFEDWKVRCGTVRETGRERCQMSQDVSRPDSDQTIMRMAVGYSPQSSQPAAVFQIPLGVVLPNGIALRVDDGEPVRFPVQICVEQGCQANLPLKQDLLQQMKAGRSAYLTMRTPRARSGRVELDISLIGFTAALQRISKNR